MDTAHAENFLVLDLETYLLPGIRPRSRRNTHTTIHQGHIPWCSKRLVVSHCTVFNNLIADCLLLWSVIDAVKDRCLTLPCFFTVIIALLTNIELHGFFFLYTVQIVCPHVLQLMRRKTAAHGNNSRPKN